MSAEETKYFAILKDLKSILSTSDCADFLGISYKKMLELINKNLPLNKTNLIVMLTLIVLILIGTIGLIIVINWSGKKYSKIKIISKKNITDQHFLNYFSLFVLLALTFDLSKFCLICVFVAILIFIGIVYIKNNIFYINPMLNILGYSFYDIIYIDSKGKEKEIRIFYKGELEIENIEYKLYKNNKNLYFLKKKK